MNELDFLKQEFLKDSNPFCVFHGDNEINRAANIFQNQFDSYIEKIKHSQSINEMKEYVQKSREIFLEQWKVAYADDSIPVSQSKQYLQNAFFKFNLNNPDKWFDSMHERFQEKNKANFFEKIKDGFNFIQKQLFNSDEHVDKLKIKMPDGVPPMIANTFTALIPAILVGLIFIAVATIFSFTPYGSFTQLVYTVIVTPLNSLGGSVWSLVVLILVQMLLWFFGIHGSNVISGVITAVYLPMATANLEAYAAGKALPNILCNTFYDTFSGIGGAGGTLSLCIVILLFAKSKQNKTMGKLGIIPGLFTINEPVVFGYPLIMNPLMAIPFILTPIVQTLVAYFSMYIGLVPRFTGVQVPWCMPIILKPLLAGGWQAAILQVVCIFIGCLIWYPFFKVSDKQRYEQEQSLEATVE